jgi:hypothetical protein
MDKLQCADCNNKESIVTTMKRSAINLIDQGHLFTLLFCIVADKHIYIDLHAFAAHCRTDD